MYKASTRFHFIHETLYSDINDHMKKVQEKNKGTVKLKMYSNYLENIKKKEENIKILASFSNIQLDRNNFLDIMTSLTYVLSISMGK